MLPDPTGLLQSLSYPNWSLSLKQSLNNDAYTYEPLIDLQVINLPERIEGKVIQFLQELAQEEAE